MLGLNRVKYWLRPDTGKDGELADDDPAWKDAAWQPCVVEPPPDDWSAHLPKGISSKELWGFDTKTGKPKEWPMRYTVVNWAGALKDLKPGAYELRGRTVDLNGFAQPHPRPHQGTGKRDPHPGHQGHRVKQMWTGGGANGGNALRFGLTACRAASGWPRASPLARRGPSPS